MLEWAVILPRSAQATDQNAEFVHLVSTLPIYRLLRTRATAGIRAFKQPFASSPSNPLASATLLPACAQLGPPCSFIARHVAHGAERPEQPEQPYYRWEELLLAGDIELAASLFPLNPEFELQPIARQSTKLLTSASLCLPNRRRLERWHVLQVDWRATQVRPPIAAI
jgi:hypothetical protein